MAKAVRKVVLFIVVPSDSSQTLRRGCCRFRAREIMLQVNSVAWANIARQWPDIRRMLATLGLFLSAGLALANSDPLQNVIPEGGVGMGAATRGEVSPYRGAGTRYDLVPVYVYEG